MVLILFCLMLKPRPLQLSIVGASNYRVASKAAGPAAWYPGGTQEATCTASLRVNNPNAYPLQLTSVIADIYDFRHTHIGYGFLPASASLPSRRASNVSADVVLSMTMQEEFGILSSCRDTPDTKTTVYILGNATVVFGGIFKVSVHGTGRAHDLVSSDGDSCANGLSPSNRHTSSFGRQ